MKNINEKKEVSTDIGHEFILYMYLGIEVRI